MNEIEVGLDIKRRLEAHDLKQSWLARQLHKIGFDVSKQHVSNMLCGMRQGTKRTQFLKLSLEILDDYEFWEED